MSLSQLSSPALTSLLPTFALVDTIAYPTISSAVCTIATPLHPTQLPGAIPSRSLDYITVPDSFRASTTIDQPHPGSIYNAVCTPTTTLHLASCALVSSLERSPTALSDVPHTKESHQAKKAPRTRYVTTKELLLVSHTYTSRSQRASLGFVKAYNTTHMAFNSVGAPFLKSFTDNILSLLDQMTGLSTSRASSSDWKADLSSPELCFNMRRSNSRKPRRARISPYPILTATTP
jgi:hypothetical protein